VAATGRRIGFIFPFGNMQGYFNLKGYWEFAAENRPDGWNAWVTFSLLATGCAACGCRKSNPNILVVQPAQDRAAKNGPG